MLDAISKPVVIDYWAGLVQVVRPGVPVHLVLWFAGLVGLVQWLTRSDGGPR